MVRRLGPVVGHRAWYRTDRVAIEVKASGRVSAGGTHEVYRRSPKTYGSNES